eukprot:5366385-Pleurochrysis_carterae.AAC.1
MRTDGEAAPARGGGGGGAETAHRGGAEGGALCSVACAVRSSTRKLQAIHSSATCAAKALEPCAGPSTTPHESL